MGVAVVARFRVKPGRGPSAALDVLTPRRTWGWMRDFLLHAGLRHLAVAVWQFRGAEGGGGWVPLFRFRIQNSNPCGSLSSLS